jgi:hypothetical protein
VTSKKKRNHRCSETSHMTASLERSLGRIGYTRNVSWLKEFGRGIWQKFDHKKANR